MNAKEVKIILEENVSDFLTSESKNCFLDGLNIIGNLSTNHDYSVGYDIFYASELDDMPGLKKDDVIKLNILGWNLDSEFNCWTRFV